MPSESTNIKKKKKKKNRNWSTNWGRMKINTIFSLKNRNWSTNRGRVIFQRKKTIANEIRPSVFASVPQSVFLVAASKTDIASKTDSL